MRGDIVIIIANGVIRANSTDRIASKPVTARPDAR
jgi:hypothetical protein